MISEALALVLEPFVAKHGEEALKLIVEKLHGHVPQLSGSKPGEDHMAEANGLVNGDRMAAYGSPKPAYDAQAQVWSGLLAHKMTEPLTASDVVLLLAAMKLVREVRRHKRDNIVDLHGYMLVLAHVLEPAPGINIPREGAV